MTRADVVTARADMLIRASLADELAQAQAMELAQLWYAAQIALMGKRLSRDLRTLCHMVQSAAQRHPHPSVHVPAGKPQGARS